MKSWGSHQSRQKPEKPTTSPVSANGRVFKLELGLPPAEASPNGRFHWGAKARAVRKYREECGLLALAQIGKRRAKGMVTIDLDFYLAPTILGDNYYRPRDRDNAISASKASCDALKDCGLIKNDSKKYVKIGNVNLYSTKREHQGQTKLVMTIREEV